MTMSFVNFLNDVLVGGGWALLVLEITGLGVMREECSFDVV